MTEKIHVTRAQKLAAQSLVARSKRSGGVVRSSISKIAKALGRTPAENTGQKPSQAKVR